MMPLLSLQYLGHPCGTSLRIEELRRTLFDGFCREKQINLKSPTDGK